MRTQEEGAHEYHHGCSAMSGRTTQSSRPLARRRPPSGDDSGTRTLPAAHEAATTDPRRRASWEELAAQGFPCPLAVAVGIPPADDGEQVE